MFTGIIQCLGTTQSVSSTGGDIRMVFKAPELDWDRIQTGDSISVNGVCLTALDLNNGEFAADVSKETLSKTSLSQVQVGSRVNLESALKVGDALGGHLVSGHVDGLAEVVSQSEDARSIRFSFRVPDHLAKFIAAKGSVCLDGVSLTVNGVKGSEFDVNIIPHTQEQTLFQEYKPGSQVNLEIDIIARYLERLVSAQSDTMPGGIDQAFLDKTGFGSGRKDP